MKKLLVSLSLLISAFNSYATIPEALPIQECVKQTSYGFPAVSQNINSTTVCRHGYVLEHNNDAHIPLWVAYTLTPAHAIGCYPRISHFVTEPSLPKNASALESDYAKSGYDIGHMANDGDMRWSAVVEAESNIFANAAPQLPEFNRGIWKTLENMTRGWAVSRNHALQIYIAPVLNKNDQKFIGKNQVPIPGAFVKIIIDTVTNEVQVYFFKHEGSKAAIDTFIASLADVERETGIKFPMPKNPIFGPWNVELKNAQKAKGNACNM
jgi:endonuclease G